MITPEQINLAEYVINESGIVATIIEAYDRDGRGRKPNTPSLRLLLVGMFLSITAKRSVTVIDIFKTLTLELPYDEQFRLGVRKMVNGKEKSLTETDLRYQVKCFNKRLSYGSRSNVLLSGVERLRRHQAIIDINNQLMDVFSQAWISTIVAIDATGIWSWGRGGAKHDDTIKNALAALEDGQDPEEVMKQLPSESPGQTTSFDPDATWSVKTHKNGKPEPLFGYQEHTVVLVPERKMRRVTNPDGTKRKVAELLEPPVILRLELTPANEDVVDVTFRLIDSMKVALSDIIVDRHYSNKAVGRWQDELRKRDINQHFDLRSTDQGFTEFESIRWAAGSAHCPGTPDEFGTISRPFPGAKKEEQEAFAAEIDKREAYKMRVVRRLNEKDSMRLECPARAGSVGCKLCPGTVQAATLKGKTIVANPPVAVEGGEPLPVVCTQGSVTVTPPDKIRKLVQKHYWGGDRWRTIYARRTYVEGCYGNRKNGSTENLRRGFFRSVGLPWANLTVVMSAAAYNVRMIQNWHARTGKGQADNPIILASAPPGAWMYLGEDEIDRIRAVYDIKMDD
jgi:hypothetical protein